MSQNQRPLILVSNDDGYLARGVRQLVSWLKEFGDIVAVCPDSARSGQSMAITVDKALRIVETDSVDGVPMYKVNGTPVDCVKLAIYALCDRKPDLVVSGINHGSNASINVVYSGTMGATFEGCAFGIPSVGFSLTDHSLDADFEGCKPFVKKIIKTVLTSGLPEGVCLNVNIPDCHPYPTEMRLVKSTKGKWSDEYERYVDPFGRPFYWLKGVFVNDEPENQNTDEWCLKHGIVSVVPVLLDRTAAMNDSLEKIKAVMGQINA
jgi:5'-nucleotidase